MSERSFDDFDEFAADYRSIHTQNIKLSGADSYYFAEHKIIEIKNYEENHSLRMLDIGCGDGAAETFVQHHFPSWAVDGIDVSELSINEASRKNISNAIFRIYDGINIPFENDSFDIVFVAAVFHHIDFSLHVDFLKEIKRVLKTGGRLYLFEHNPLNPATKYFVKTCVFDKDARLLSYTYTKKILQNAAFRSLQKRFILFFPRKGILSKLIRIEKGLGWVPLGAQYFFRCLK